MLEWLGWARKKRETFSKKFKVNKTKQNKKVMEVKKTDRVSIEFLVYPFFNLEM